jgi:maltose O-acetyltransferase
MASNFWLKTLYRLPMAVKSRILRLFYAALGLTQAGPNLFEGANRVRRHSQIQIGQGNAFSFGCCLWPADEEFGGCRIQIGDNNYFNRFVMIDACGEVCIGSNNMIGPDVYITDSNHRVGLGLLPNETAMDRGVVVIKDACWIGAKAIILKDVVIETGAVVAAGAVVTQSVPAWTVVAGVPARKIGTVGPAGITVM